MLASPGHAPGTIAVNVTWMKTGFNAYQKHRSMYPSIFNRFPVIQPVSSKIRHFSTFWAFWPPLGTPLGQSRQMLHGQKEDSMPVKRIAVYNAIPIFLQPFTSYKPIVRYWSEIATFSYHLVKCNVETAERPRWRWSTWTIFVIFGGCVSG